MISWAGGHIFGPCLATTSPPPPIASEQCRSFRAGLSPEDRASFDTLLRSSARFLQAGTRDPNLMHSEVLALSLSLACAGQLEDLRARVSDLEEQVKALGSWR